MSGRREKGKGPEDPFVDYASSTEQDENSPLFYAYARRTDNYWASRYLLTFANAHVCNEWWSLIQSEYPAQAVRHGSQLFSFQGDNFLSKPSTSKKFEHLKTQWFYTQIGDASGTGGRGQDIIPLQDSEGRILGNPGTNELASWAKSDKGKEREVREDEHFNSPGFDMGALGESLQNTQAMLEMNNAQIAQLTESQARDQEHIEHVEKVLEDNARQLQALTRAHMKTQQQTQELAEQNAKLIRELKKQRLQQQQQQQQVQPEQSLKKEVIPAAPASDKEACPHNVRPPPRKLDKPLVGYAYGNDARGNIPSQKRSDAVKR